MGHSEDTKYYAVIFYKGYYPKTFLTTYLIFSRNFMHPAFYSQPMIHFNFQPVLLNVFSLPYVRSNLPTVIMMIDKIVLSIPYLWNFEEFNLFNKCVKYD